MFKQKFVLALLVLGFVCSAYSEEPSEFGDDLLECSMYAMGMSARQPNSENAKVFDGMKLAFWAYALVVFSPEQLEKKLQLMEKDLTKETTPLYTTPEWLYIRRQFCGDLLKRAEEELRPKMNKHLKSAIPKFFP